MTRRFRASQTRKLAVEVARPIHRALRVQLIHTDQTMIEPMDAAGHRSLDWLDSVGIPDVPLFAVQSMRIRISILPPTNRRSIAPALRHRTTSGMLPRDTVARFCSDEDFDVDVTRRDSLRLPFTTTDLGDPNE